MRWHAERDGRSLRDFIVLRNLIETRSPSVTFGDSALPEGAYGHARTSLGVWALPEAFVIQMRNWRYDHKCRLHTAGG